MKLTSASTSISSYLDVCFVFRQKIRQYIFLVSFFRKFIGIIQLVKREELPISIEKKIQLCVRRHLLKI